jgi:hypothetical protein
MATKSKFGMSEGAALGFRAHSGWTMTVAVAGSLSKPGSPGEPTAAALSADIASCSWRRFRPRPRRQTF